MRTLRILCPNLELDHQPYMAAPCPIQSLFRVSIAPEVIEKAKAIASCRPALKQSKNYINKLRDMTMLLQCLHQADLLDTCFLKEYTSKFDFIFGPHRNIVAHRSPGGWQLTVNCRHGNMHTMRSYSFDHTGARDNFAREERGLPELVELADETYNCEYSTPHECFQKHFIPWSEGITRTSGAYFMTDFASE